MNGIISTETYIKDIKKGLNNDVLFSKIGEFLEDDFIEVCRSATRISLDTLVVDVTCASGKVLVKGLKMYRIQKPKTRIIIFAPDKKPGDIIISNLVNMGIYDIVAPDIPEVNDSSVLIDFSHDLIYQVQNPSTYADAVRWIISDEQISSQNKKNKKDKELPTEFIIKEKVIGSIIIAIGGVERRTGTTHTALQISSFLAKQKFKVACVELVDENLNPPVFETFNTNEVSKRNPEGFHLKKIDFFKGDVQLFNLYKSDYDYIVLDLGKLFGDDNTYFNSHLSEFIRANLQIITSFSSVWDFADLLTFFERKNKINWNAELNILLNLANEEIFNETKSAFSKNELNEWNIQLFMNDFIPDPFKGSKESDILEKLLSDILPKDKRLKRNFLQRKIFKKNIQEK